MTGRHATGRLYCFGNSAAKNMTHRKDDGRACPPASERLS